MNPKLNERKGKIQVVNVVTFFEKMRRSLENKRNEKPLADIRADIIALEQKTEGMIQEVLEG